MRSALLAILLVTAAPSAAAASQVHVTYVNGDYAITFESGLDEPSILVGDTTLFGRRMPERAGDDDAFYTARVRAADLTYELEGRTFDLRAPPAPHEATRIVFVADVGATSEARAVLARILNESPDLVLIGGDLSYAHANASLWNEWFEMMEPLAARVPMMPAFGNHEDYCEDAPGELRACGPDPNEWHEHFVLPNAPNLYYAFDWGPARVTVLDTEAYVHDEGAHASGRAEQEAFLAGTLDADQDRWDIVMFHRPLRSTSAREGAANEQAREALEPTLDEKADLVLAGHLHAYERAHPRGDGPLYVTSGGGGRSLYDDWGPEEPWLAARATEFHYVLLEVSPGRIEGSAISINGTEIDRFELSREVPASLRPPTPPAATPISTPPPSATPTPPTSTSTGTRAPTDAAPPTESNDAPFLPLLALLATAALVAARRRLVRP